MTFLQPLLLIGLPLVALPIVIHLINQRRFHTIRWAAMMFLLAANRMSRGYARIRQWLILLARMLAIAGLILAVSRPLASGWLGLTMGARADTTIIVLDRSPSMHQQQPGTTESKFTTGCRQIVEACRTLGSANWAVITDPNKPPRELESSDEILNLPELSPHSAAADLPALLQVARDYIRTNKTGRTEIWICSDVRRNDWHAESSRWQALRDSFREFPQGIRFHLVAFPEPAPQNVAVRVTEVRREEVGENAELVISLRVTREEPPGTKPTPLSVPLQIDVEGASSQVSIELPGAQFELRDHRIALDRKHERGWGRVSIPADSNPADNDAYFVFDKPALRKTIIVADDPNSAGPLQLAASISPGANVVCAAEVVGRDQIATVDWDGAALVLWQGALPVADMAAKVRSFTERGGTVIFFPPRTVADEAFEGLRWSGWSELPEGFVVESWRGDQDLLAQTQSGAALPVGQLRVFRKCDLQGEFTALAELKGGGPLLVRVPTLRGAIYFCSTTMSPADSTFAAEGVVLYVLIQRAAAAGTMNLMATRHVIAGEASQNPQTPWEQLLGSSTALSTEWELHSGVYRAGEHLLALNRSPLEDHAEVLPASSIDRLFDGLDFVRVDAQAGSLAALIEEIWRAFLIAMLIALIAEAVLCLPRRTPAASGLITRPAMNASAAEGAFS